MVKQLKNALCFVKVVTSLVTRACTYTYKFKTQNFGMIVNDFTEGVAWEYLLFLGMHLTPTINTQRQGTPDTAPKCIWTFLDTQVYLKNVTVLAKNIKLKKCQTWYLKAAFFQNLLHIWDIFIFFLYVIFLEFTQVSYQLVIFC